MLLYVLYLILTVLGLSLVKLDKNSLLFDIKNTGIHLGIGFLTIVGMFCYIASFSIFMIIIQKNELSYIYPILNGLVAIMTFIVGTVIFNEVITLQKVIGFIVIVIGIFIINIRG